MVSMRSQRFLTPSIDRTITLKAQKVSKDFNKTVLQWFKLHFMKRQEYCLCAINQKRQLLCQLHLLCCVVLCHGHVINTDAEERKLLNKVVMIGLLLNHWSHTDYFNNVFTNFLCLNVVLLLMESESCGCHQNYLPKMNGGLKLWNT